MIDFCHHELLISNCEEFYIDIHVRTTRVVPRISYLFEFRTLADVESLIKSGSCVLRFNHQMSVCLFINNSGMN